MDNNLISALISGASSIISAFGAVFLKEYLDGRVKKSTSISSTVQPSTTDQTRITHSSGTSKYRLIKKRIRLSLVVRPILLVIFSISYGYSMASLAWGHWGLSITYGIFKAWIILFVVILLLVFYHKNKGSLMSFQLENLAIWCGFASGLFLASGGGFEKYFGGMIPSWIGCAIFGGILLIWLQSKSPNKAN